MHLDMIGMHAFSLSSPVDCWRSGPCCDLCSVGDDLMMACVGEMEVGTVPAEEALQEMGEDEGEVRGGTQYINTPT